MRFRGIAIAFTLVPLLLGQAVSSEFGRPNILFIAFDDLNDWIGCMGGHPQSVTPNLDRLAANSVLFTNAHCPAPACNPSRTAIFTGIAPNQSGMYDNAQKMREILPDEVIIPEHFRKHGYRSIGSGKMLHYFIDAPSWDEYFPEAESENPFPRTLYPDKRPLSLPRAGPWQYVETDWGPLDATDKEFGGDWLVTDWVGKQLLQEIDEPLFLACGIYRPHEPWFVPKKYFEPFPLEEIQIPPGYKEDDLDDLPSEGKKRGPNRYFEHIQKEGQWKNGIQGYLASIHFADAMLGRVLDALEKGPNRDTTIIVLWSDHGWQLGEKQHWQKFSPWRQVTRVPLMIKVPPAIASGLPDGTRAGEVCDRPVNLLSLLPTLTDLAGIPEKEKAKAPSLVSLLKNSEAEWNHVAVTYLSDRGSFAISDEEWRYIRYSNGEEELYFIPEDPYEWKNLANDSKQKDRLEYFREISPKKLAPKREATVDSLGSITWNPLIGDNVPPSRPDGATFKVPFLNNRNQTVELFWIDQQGKPKSYGKITGGKSREQQTRPGAVWQVLDAATGTPLGFFRIGDRRAKAVVPAE